MYSPVESSTNLIVVPDRDGCRAKMELFEQGMLGLDELVNSRLVCPNSGSGLDTDVELDLVSTLKAHALL